MTTNKNNTEYQTLILAALLHDIEEGVEESFEVK
jgi:HD superfamily phosphohydrolase